MSYILDALQRADAERARGGVPTLHARPIASPSPADRWGTRHRLALASAVVVALGAAVAAWWWSSQPVQTQAAAPVMAAPAALPAPAATPLAVLPPPTPAPAPVRPVAATPSTPPSAAKPQTAVPVAQPPTATPSKAKAVATVAPAVVEATAPATTPSPALAPLLSELPEATRRQIPAIAISGAVYSENPAQRLLLVNGQVLNQGNQVAPDLTVVEIRSNMSEFNFRGTRFRLAH